MDWAIDLERELEEMEPPKAAKLSIYKVPASKKELHKFAFTPLVVSFGPYHHDQEELRIQMEAHKRRALRHFCQNSGKGPKTLVDLLQPLAQSLMDSYELLDAKWDPDTFLQLMLLDGCFMLEILRANEAINKPGDTYGDYAGVQDPIFSYHGKFHVMPYIKRDMLLLENQIPMEFLLELVYLDNKFVSQREEAAKYLYRLILNFVNPPSKLPESEIIHSLHILDLYRKSLLGFGLIQQPSQQNTRVESSSPNTQVSRIRSAEQLVQAGIHIGRSRTTSLTDISFSDYRLRLPSLVVNDNTELAFLNLIMFERLHVGAGNEITSFVAFMKNIIDSPNDLVWLHIIRNDIGSDKDVVDLFKRISKDLTPDPHPDGRLGIVQSELNLYCRKRGVQWRAALTKAYLWRYFTSPLEELSLYAGTLLMILTLAQTIYAIVSYHYPSKK